MPINSIVITENPVTDWEMYEQTLDEARFANPTIVHRDQGGFWQASFEYIPRDREDAIAFLNNGVGRNIVFYNENGSVDWEGFINTITMDTGTATLKNTLSGMANKVWTRYTPVGGGAVTRGTVMEDADSQARYGIKEIAISGGEISSTIADQLAQAFLNLNFWPIPQLDQINLAGSLLNQPRITISCHGYFRTLEWRVWNQTAVGGTQGASAEVTDIIGTFEEAAPASLKDDLVSWWTLDEESTGVAPVTRLDSHSANDLTDNNTTASATAKVNLGADFELTNNEWLSHADNAELSVGDIDFTIGCWLKLESKAATARIIAKWGLANNSEYTLFYSLGTNRLFFNISTNGVAVVGLPANTIGAPAVGTWYFILCWHDSVANTLNIQVNDGGVDSIAHATGVFDGASDFNLGGEHAGAANPLDGIVDEAFLIKRVLTASERTALYNGASGVGYDDIGKIVHTGGVAPFVASSKIEGNASVVTKEYDADRKAGDILQSIADLGNSQFRIFIVGMEEDRNFYYKEAQPPTRQF